MTWCNDSDDERAIQIITTTSNDASVTISQTKNDEFRTVTCPSCGHHIEFQDQAGIHDLPGLPAGVSKDGQIRHFFHRPSKAYTTGTRKRRKVNTDEDGSETRWHKTGKTRPVSLGGEVKGFKKILVLYTNYGRQRKPEKTNWVMHQYHLGSNEEEKDGELVVSKKQAKESLRENSDGMEELLVGTVLEAYYEQAMYIYKNIYTHTHTYLCMAWDSDVVF
ncbi:hypothetical protein FEM48_Zijuj01G0033700 [Ziziphus jujuba var. spinosa]|uniref:NAC domain-containing protein n=1 Tax=Ziziphus jujuba var. spinosa TaxID=714518 RepID=A0A978VYV3_ZIZJJ|nr:hypothetical protein FEM48_Zijuj01G0033700 [Ziziphus jujuba var. spinosa]